MNLPNNKNNLVSFLQHHQPIPPQACPDLEQRILDSLEPRKLRDRKCYKTLTWTIPSAIATGFLFTTVSFGVRTPRIAIEPKDLENFLIDNWQDTLNTSNVSTMENLETNWLLPDTSCKSEAQTSSSCNLSVLAQ